jgi:hypothetical protein
MAKKVLKTKMTETVSFLQDNGVYNSDYVVTYILKALVNTMSDETFAKFMNELKQVVKI